MNLAEREPLKFVVGDRAVTADEILRAAPKIKRPPPLQESFHKGFRVEGHPPGALEAAQKLAERVWEDFDRARRQGKSNGKPPPQWNELIWRQSCKKRPVRAKPYEVPEAAKVCADMAMKAGWLDVVVVEIKREVSGS